MRVLVPGSSANLGPGFDCFGMAWQCYNEMEFERVDAGLHISGCPEAFQNETNLAYVGFQKALERSGVKEEGGLVIRFGRTEIPVCRGLGSSAALIAAGVAAANRLYGLGMDEDALLDAGTAVEGHPDNVAPSLFGGLTASAMVGTRAVTAHFPVSDKLHFTGLIPDFELSTSLARAVLPATLSRADAIFNVSRGALLLRALADGDADLLRCAIDDRLHQPYRWELIAGSDIARQLAADCGAFGVCISGAGPTILCVSGGEDFDERLRRRLAEALPSWELRPLPLDKRGVQCLES